MIIPFLLDAGYSFLGGYYFLVGYGFLGGI